MKRVTTTKTTVEEFDENESLVRREITEETIEEVEDSKPTTPYVSPYTGVRPMWYQNPVTYTINSGTPVESVSNAIHRYMNLPH
jgi:hypothetical protein